MSHVGQTAGKNVLRVSHVRALTYLVGSDGGAFSSMSLVCPSFGQDCPGIARGCAGIGWDWEGTCPGLRVWAPARAVSPRDCSGTTQDVGHPSAGLPVRPGNTPMPRLAARFGSPFKVEIGLDPQAESR